MKTKLIRIGNSRGIRIPKALLDQCHLKERVELETKNGCLTIRPVDTPREGWAGAFRQMAEAGDDTLRDQDTLPVCEWDETEWEWQSLDSKSILSDSTPHKATKFRRLVLVLSFHLTS